jgi:hypothetical protein
VFGQDTFCALGECRRSCKSAEDCPGAHCALDSYRPTSYCSAGLAKLSEPCTNNSQCRNGMTCMNPRDGIGECTIDCGVDSDCDGAGMGSTVHCMLGMCSKDCDGIDEDCRIGSICVSIDYMYSFCSH